MRIGVFGAGIIGSEVIRRAVEKNWNVVVARKSGVYDGKTFERKGDLDCWKHYFYGVNIAVLCIPTEDGGKEACNYILELTKMKIPVVTSEKGSLANYFLELKSSLPQIGYSATVGGGSGLLRWLKENVTAATEIHMVVNGTLNYMFSGLERVALNERKTALDRLAAEVKILGYAEPAAQDALDIINRESCGDVPMKTAIVLNTIFGLHKLAPLIRASEIRAQRLVQKDLQRIMEAIILPRYIVSIAKKKLKEDLVGGFSIQTGEYFVSGGFKYPSQNPLLIQMSPQGVTNAAMILNGKKSYVCFGPGAGAIPTVNVIMEDVKRFI